jgi:hypothetical protein
VGRVAVFGLVEQRHDDLGGRPGAAGGQPGLGRLGERVEQGFEDFGGERCDLGGGVAMTLSEACEVTDLLAAVPDGGYGS